MRHHNPIKLEQCPFCGSYDIVAFGEEDGYNHVKDTNVFRGVAGCNKCGMGYEMFFEDDDPMFDGCTDPSDIEKLLTNYMIEKWNTRVFATQFVSVMEDDLK